MSDLTQKKSLSAYSIKALADGDTVLVYDPDASVGQRVKRGQVVFGDSAGLIVGTSTAGKIYNDEALNEWRDTARVSEVWSGTATASLDLTGISGGYPGDGVYVVTFSGGTGMIHFIEGEICYSTPRAVTGSIEMNKSATEVLTMTGSVFTQIRRLS